MTGQTDKRIAMHHAALWGRVTNYYRKCTRLSLNKVSVLKCLFHKVWPNCRLLLEYYERIICQAVYEVILEHVLFNRSQH